MEDLICKTSSTGTQIENVCLKVDREDCLNSTALFPLIDISHKSEGNSENMIKDESAEKMNGYIDISCGPLCESETEALSESEKQKTYSPTLIESAFKVMKNLFSPDKAKSKSSTSVSPKNNQKSGSGTPCTSICFSGKTDLYALEPENEIHSSVQFTPGENNFRNYLQQLQNNELEIVQTPLTLEPLNNTDESFMTTVSLIDDSFHSAVTHLDENGELLRNSGNLKENILNNSQNLDLIDPYNDTLETSESCLENTTLKIGYVSYDGNNMTNFSVQNRDGVMENLNNLQTDGEPIYINDSRKPSVIEVQSGISSNQNQKDLKSEIMDIISKGEAAQVVDSQERFKKTAFFLNDNSEIKNAVKNVEMADIFLNKAFSTLPSLKPNRSLTGCFDQDIMEEIKENVEMTEMEINKNQNDIPFEGSNNEDICIDNSISTTTVVLNTVESVDLENMLMSLKADDSGTNISSLTSSEGEDAICSLENVMSEYDNNGAVGSRLFLSNNPKRSCNSEGSSPNKSDSAKVKLNKSDELISHTTLTKPEKMLGDVKSSVDFSLMKHSETSEITKESNDVKCSENFKEPKDVGIDKHNAESSGVISQQSYTILTVHDKNLNRPVIESPNTTDGLSEQQAFQKDNSGSAFAAESEVFGKCFVSNISNASFASDDLEKSNQIKQSTPLCEGHNETSKKFFRPTPLKLHSPEITETTCDDQKITENFEECDLTNKKAKQTYPTNEVVSEFPFINSTDVSEVEFLNSAENGEDKNHQNPIILSSTQSNNIIQSPYVKLKLKHSKKSLDNDTEIIVQKLNQTFHNNQISPDIKDQVLHEVSTSHSTNQMLRKKSKSPGCEIRPLDVESHARGQDKLNVTFDINISPNSNSTFTKETKLPETDEGNLTFEKSESSTPALLNETYDMTFKNQLNQTFNKKTESSELHKLREKCYKKRESPVPGEIIKVSDGMLESHTWNETNQTFVLDNTHLEKTDESKETFEIAHINDTCVGRLESDSKIDHSLIEETKTSEKNTEIFTVSHKPVPNDGQTYLSSGVPIGETHHYRTTVTTEFAGNNDANESFVSTKSSNTSLFCSDISTVVFNEEGISKNENIINLEEKFEKMNLNENAKQISKEGFTSSVNQIEGGSFLQETVEGQSLQIEENLLSSLRDEKLRCDPDLVQLIQEQFSSNDIEKICRVVQDLSSIKLSNNILKASEQFDKSFHESIPEVEFKLPQVELNDAKIINALSPQSFDFLNSIGGKPTGRDLSRESLYVKFDPLVQPSANSLIDFTKEGEALAAVDASPVNANCSSICEQLLTISPQKTPDAIVPPLTPLSHKVKEDVNENKLERLKELQNEIYFLKNLYAERERCNKSKMEDYENQIAKLTGEGCMLEDKLKESNEREKSLVKKMKEQAHSLGQLKIIMEEYVKVISKLSSELETIKNENLRQLETLSLEKDSYMTHLQNTEAAFTDVHAKYEKSKKTIVNLKANETLYKNTITEQAQKMEEFKLKAKEAQEKAMAGFQKIQEELNETKTSHSQETARLRAQLRKTELKVEALQESLDQKIKENQQLTAICDELIEGKK